MVRAVLGGRPRCDGSLCKCLRAVGNDQVRVEVDRITEALAARAGTEGIVEGEESRFRLAVGTVARRALERCGVTQFLRRCLALAGHCMEADLAGLTVARLDGVDDAAANI